MILIKTCFDRSSTNFRTSFFGPDINRHQHERKYVCLSRRFGNNLGPSGVGDSSDFPGHSRGVDATILVLCDIRTVLCSISTLRLLSVPASYHSSGSGGSANKSWSTSACRNAVCTSIETVMWFDSVSLFLSCELAASIVFRDNVDGVGENISGCATPLTSIVVFQD